MSWIAADVDWLGTLGNEDLFEIAQLKWRSFMVEFNLKKLYPLDHALSIIFLIWSQSYALR